MIVAASCSGQDFRARGSRTRPALARSKAVSASSPFPGRGTGSFTPPRSNASRGRRGNFALRAAAPRRLPSRLADAPKRGFPVPLADWLRQEKYYALVKAKLTGPAAERFFDTGALCALLDAHRAGKTNAMTKLWAFYCFIEWYEVYFTGKIPPDL